MSSTLNASPTIDYPNVVPQTPWAPPKEKRRQDWLIAAGIGVIAYAIVLFTGMAGPDGWAVTFFFLILGFTLYRARTIDAKQRKDALMSLAIKSLAILAFTPWLSIFFSLLQQGYKAFHLGYLFSDMRTTSSDDELNMGGVLHAITGSLIMVAMATVVTLPLGILSGAYLTEIRGRMSFLVRFVIQSMSGVPSIVAGLFIYTTVVTQMKQYSGLAGSLALAILMLPTVARTSEEVLKLVPDELRNASYALGSRQWRTAIMIVIPTVRSGLVTAAILGIARVVGETAPLLLTSLAANDLRFNPFSGPIGSLPSYVFGLLVQGTEYSVARAWAGSFVLMTVVGSLFALARYIGNKGPRA